MTETTDKPAVAVDFERVQLLLNVEARAAANGARYAAITGEATHELTEINIEAQKAADARAKEKAEKEAADKKKADDIAKKEADARAAKDKEVADAAAKAAAPKTEAPVVEAPMPEATWAGAPKDETKEYETVERKL